MTIFRNRVSTKWYYSIELAPGHITNGEPFGTCSLVHSLLDNCSLKGQRCIDLGCQEGLNTVKLCQKGASQVTAYDFVSMPDRIEAVQRAYNVSFSYFSNLTLPELPSALEKHNQRINDFVLFAGVLYHLLDPTSGIGIARSIVRDGGLALFETSLLISDEMKAEFNSGGRYYSASNYWQVSLALFEYQLRMAHFKPLDIAYIKPSSDNVGRVAVVCRAMDSVQIVGHDPWMQKDWFVKNNQIDSLDFDKTRCGLRDVPYKLDNEYLKFHPQSDQINLHETLIQMPNHKIDKDRTVLRLPKQNSRDEAAPTENSESVDVTNLQKSA